MLRALTEEERAWVEQTFARLSLREKIGQTMQDHAGRLPFGEADEDTIGAYLERYPVGGLFIGGAIIHKASGKAGDYRSWMERFQKKSKVPLLVSGDLEFGAGSAVGSLTSFPSLPALAAADDEKLAYNYGKYTALEGRAAGFTWALAPTVDILTNWMNPVIATRCLGDDPARIKRLAAAIIRGMQDHGMAACAKHFPGDGVDFRDQHIVTTVNSLTEAAWEAAYGDVARHLIGAGLLSWMTGHIALPWIEGNTAGSKPVPATVSSKITTGLLRGRLGFRGVVLSDALDMGGFIGWGGYERRIVDCLNSGTDILLWPGTRYFDTIEKALERGEIQQERLDESVRRVLELKARLGLARLDDEGRDPQALPLEDGRLASVKLAAEARAVAGEVAQRSITLVRNRAQLLPLNPETTRRVLVVMLNKVTEDRKFFRMDRFVDLLRERGLEVDVLDEFEPLVTVRRWEEEGSRWDAAFVPYFLTLHGMMNTSRPVGEAAKGIWALQQAETISPIGISFATPHLLQDMPFLDTLVNVYSLHEDSLQATVRALFGEQPFPGRSPVNTGEEEFAVPSPAGAATVYVGATDIAAASADATAVPADATAVPADATTATDDTTTRVAVPADAATTAIDPAKTTNAVTAPAVAAAQEEVFHEQ